MQDDHNPAPVEIVSRILVRDDDLDLIDRSIREEDDFIRKGVYGLKQQPENGLSLFRRRISDQQILFVIATLSLGSRLFQRAFHVPIIDRSCVNETSGLFAVLRCFAPDSNTRDTRGTRVNSRLADRVTKRAQFRTAVLFLFEDQNRRFFQFIQIVEFISVLTHATETLLNCLDGFIGAVFSVSSCSL